MKVLLTQRGIAPLVLLCCFVCLGSPSLRAQSIVYDGFNPMTGLKLNGSAGAVGASGPTVLRLTPAATNQVGSAWYTTLVPVSNGFSTTFTFQLGGSTAGSLGPADGIAFVIQGDGCFGEADCGTSALDPETGGGIGYDGLTNSLVIEFDTYQNPWDPNNNHVAVQSCGPSANSVEHPTCELGIDPSLLITLADGSPHTATIMYTPPSPSGCQSSCSNGTLQVTLDGHALSFSGTGTSNLNLASLLNLGTNGTAFVGFTAATGGGDDNQDILSWSFTPVTQPGTTINQGNPSSLSQQFKFNTNTGQQVEFDFDFTTANSSGALHVPDGTAPSVSDTGITQVTWQQLVQGTALADTSCLLAAGQKDPNGIALCASQTLTCTKSGDPTAKGANCPTSTERDLLFSQVVDLANSSITIPPGYAPGIAMGPDIWNAPSCAFPNDGNALFGQLCPQSLLTQIEEVGDPASKPGGTGLTPNSTFVYFCCEPEWTTTPNNIPLWTNSTTVPVSFTSVPPLTPTGDINGFHASQGASVTFGAEPRAAALDATFPLPAEQTVPNSTPCPNTPQTWSGQAPAQFSVSGNVTNYDNSGSPAALTEGAWDLHYFSTDCDSFEELVFPASIDTNSTLAKNLATFKTVPFNVDTTAPTVAVNSLSPASGPYPLGSVLTASLTCTDPVSGGVVSGIKTCGAQPYSGPTGPASVTTNVTLPTNSSGSQTYPVTAIDQAGNPSAPQNIQYIVGTPLTISPALVNFGTLYLGQVGGQFVTLTNTGTSPVTISSVQTGAPGTATGDYGSISLCPPMILKTPATLPAGKSCKIGVGILASQKIFSPTASTATITITDSATASTQQVLLTAQVIDPLATLSTYSLNFGKVSRGGTSTKTVTLTNTGYTPLSLNSIAISGTYFTLSTTCAPGTINPAAPPCALSVSFKPTTKGTFTGKVTIADNAFFSPQVIILSGTGN